MAMLFVLKTSTTWTWSAEIDWVLVSVAKYWPISIGRKTRLLGVFDQRSAHIPALYQCRILASTLSRHPSLLHKS